MTPSPSSAQQGQSTSIPRVAAAARVVRADSTAALSESWIIRPDPDSGESCICYEPLRVPAAPARPVPVAAARVARREIIEGRSFSSRRPQAGECSSYSSEYDEAHSQMSDHFKCQPTKDSGRIDYSASWGRSGDEFWEFWLKATAVRLRRDAYELGSSEEESALLRKSLPQILHRDSVPRVRDVHDLLDVLDRRIPRVIGDARSRSPADREKRTEQVGGSLWRINLSTNSWDKRPKGVAQVVSLFRHLNWKCPDCIDGGYFVP